MASVAWRMRNVAGELPYRPLLLDTAYDAVAADPTHRIVTEPVAVKFPVAAGSMERLMVLPAVLNRQMLLETMTALTITSWVPAA